ncbi:MAG: LPS export ABC transporter permease LptF [Alphaproteobacteria bacterium]|nr:LPS export ABC transporter permease LptF [Alphaproteobacteria bacterium]
MKDLIIATVLIAVTLAGVVFLTQSLKFLELVIGSGAGAGSFWVLAFLALPRFFEIILPLALMAGTVFVFHRMLMDSELVVMRAAGFSPLKIARPALALGVFITLFLWVMTFWLAPVSLAGMQKAQEVIRAQFSSFLFREGVFNSFGSDITFYIREKDQDGALKGLLIHDNREKAETPSIIFAKRGEVLSSPDGFEVTVYDGARQSYDREKKILQTLKFQRYNIQIPNSGPVRQRWREPEERTIWELLKPDSNVERDVESRRDFTVEINKRLTSPLLAILFSLIACCCLLMGPSGRRGQSRKVMLAIMACVVIEGLYLASFNIARQHDIGFVMMYGLVVLPLLGCGLLISGRGEALRRKILYGKKKGAVS